MIYMDNAATSLQKPLQVEQAVLEALRTAGNPGRGAHEATLHASRLVYGARAAAAELFDAEDASRIAFTANATEALNIAISGLIRPGDHVITTVCEHNSVLRPLYRLRDQGATLSFVGVDARGNLKYEELEAFLRPETRAVVITGASNVTGNVTDLSYISSFVKRNGLLLIVDASQTAGEELFSVQKLGIDVLCFTGHKALLGPQGTGGLYVKPGLSVEPLLVGGSGIHSYDEHHPKEMPTALEAGTLNVHGLAGLAAGIRYRMDQGIEKLQKRERDLTRRFYEQVKEIPGIIVYGAPAAKCHAPIVSLNLAGKIRHVWRMHSGKNTASASARGHTVRRSCTGRLERSVREWCGSVFRILIRKRRLRGQQKQFGHWQRKRRGEIGSMREKHPFIVLSFQTTVAAMEWEKRCMETGIPGRLIPLPREISAGCGLAWRMRPEEWEQWSGRIDTSVYDKVSCVWQ